MAQKEKPEVNKMLSPKEVAQRYGCNVEKIHRFIATGELQAINVGTRGSKIPRFRISPEALADFERSRAVSSPPPEPAPRKKATPAGVKQYY